MPGGGPTRTTGPRRAGTWHDQPVSTWDHARNAERRAVVRSVAAVLVLLLLVSLVSTWLTDISDDPAQDVLGLGYGPAAGGSTAAALALSLPPLLVLATAVAAGLVATDPRRRRSRVLAGVGALGAGALLLVALGVAVDDDVVGGHPGLPLALLGCVAAAVLGARAASFDLTRNRDAVR